MRLLCSNTKVETMWYGKISEMRFKKIDTQSVLMKQFLQFYFKEYEFSLLGKLLS